MPFSHNDVHEVAEILKNSKYLVVFTGAGISTESGLPDYRGPEGVWTLRDKGLKPKLPRKPMHLIEPNPGHFAIFDLYKLGLLKYLISQNVDNLHIKSGIPSEILAELHGNSSIMKCLACDTRFLKQEIGWQDHIHGKGYRTEKPRSNQPKCPHCEDRIISSVVNFNDPMPEKEMQEAEKHTRQCDVMLTIGSTLSVVPAASFPVIAKRLGACLIIINMGKTELDNIADIRIEAKSGEFLPLVIDHIKALS
ncbi:MAG: NAD-dependent deacetylase [Promethearchaeota archaeon]